MIYIFMTYIIYKDMDQYCVFVCLALFSKPITMQLITAGLTINITKNKVSYHTVLTGITFMALI